MPKITHFYIGKNKSNSKHLIKNKLGLLFALLFIVLFYLLCDFVMERNVYPVVTEFAESKTEYIGETIINKAVLDYVESNNIDYNNLYSINTTADGKITSIEANTYEINKLKSQLAINIQEEINKSDDMYISIPVMCVTGNVFLSDVGPKIDISLLLSGDNETELISEFTSVGFNQTRHDIYIEFSYKIKALIPGNRAETVADCKVPVISMVVVGDVPETLVNVTK